MSVRTGRVEDLLTREIAEVLRTRVKDPRIGFCTIMGVTVTADIRIAKVHVSIIGDERSKRDTMAGLKACTPFVRREVARAVKLRTMPELLFIYDDSPEKGEHVLQIMRELEKHDTSPDSGQP